MHSVRNVMVHGKLFNELGNNEISSSHMISGFFFSPKCRVKVTGKKKNFVINGILEAYLKAYPHKRPQPKVAEDDPNKTNNNRHQVR